MRKTKFSEREQRSASFTYLSQNVQYCSQHDYLGNYVAKKKIGTMPHSLPPTLLSVSIPLSSYACVFEIIIF